jgi:hypothetical protein
MVARGKDRWRLRYRVGGKRYTKAFQGSITEAKRELRRLLKSVDDGTHVAPDKTTVAEYLRNWLDNDTDLSPKTLERYRQLADQQIIPHLGAIVLQNLRSARVGEWHATLLKSGGKNGRPLSARTVGHAHRVLHRALERALRLEIISRNVARAVRPPKVNSVEVEILSVSQMADVLARLAGHCLHPIASLALGTGMRRAKYAAYRGARSISRWLRCGSCVVSRKRPRVFASSRAKHSADDERSAYRPVLSKHCERTVAARSRND